MSQTAPNAPRPSAHPCLAVHTESVLVGMRMYALAITNRQPAEDQLMMIFKANEQNKLVTGRSFPIEQLDMFALAEQSRREQMAKDFLTVLLHHVIDVHLMSRDSMEKLAAKAWELTGAFSSEARSAQLIDQLSPVAAKPGAAPKAT